MNFIALNVIICTLLFQCAALNNELRLNNSSNNTFIATKEWREIKEGQGIPAGLHVRINLQTGKREAKLLDGSEGDDNATPSNEKGLTLEYKTEHFKHIQRMHKSYKELKKTYDEMRDNFKTDAEVIIELLAKYRNVTKNEPTTDGQPPMTLEAKQKVQLQLLDNFEFLLHQIDNAMLFIDNAGLDLVLLPLVVNETNNALRVNALRVLGGLTQNNPKAQIKVYERNFGSHLAQIIMTSANREELSTALFAFSSLLRKFPFAQLRVLSTSGMQALVGIISKEDCELKTKAKAVTLISDLIIDKNLIMDFNRNEQDRSAVAQYALLDFDEWLKANDYCETLDTMMTIQFLRFLEQAEYIENFVTAMEQTKKLCQPLWSQSPQLRHALLTLKNRFLHSGIEYQLELAQQIAKLCDDLYEERKAAGHDEF